MEKVLSERIGDQEESEIRSIFLDADEIYIDLGGGRAAEFWYLRQRRCAGGNFHMRRATAFENSRRC